MSATPTRVSTWCLPALLSVGLLLSGCGGSPSAGAASSGAASTGASSPGGDTSAATSTAPRTAAETTTKVPPPPPPPPAPSNATCRALTHADLARFSNDTPAKPCTDPHTAYTYAVPTLPGSVAFTGVQIENLAVQGAAADRCRSAYVAFIGGDEATRALSRLSFTYFLPDQHAFDLGAHWVRCDVVALQSANSLGELPDRVAGFLDSPAALDAYGLCSRGEPGVSGSALVMCAQPHTYRALAAIRLGAADAPYPGEGSTLDAGKQRCKVLVGQQLGRTGGFTYAWTYPSSDDWATGQRFGYCWNETDR